MKPKHFLLVACALTMSSCWFLNDGHEILPTYYTYVNGTDKAITLTTYKGDYYEGTYVQGIYVEPTFSFTIAPGEEFTLSLSNLSYPGEYGAYPPFAGIWAEDLTISDGERIVTSGIDHLRGMLTYERRDTKNEVFFKYVITEKDFKYTMPIIPGQVD